MTNPSDVQRIQKLEQDLEALGGVLHTLLAVFEREGLLTDDDDDEEEELN